MSESRKAAVKKVMRMMNCSRAAAESYVDSKLAQISAQIQQGRKPVELGKNPPSPQPDARFLVH